MSKEQILNSRLQLKTDTPENWAKASEAESPFIPKKGEPIIYQDGNVSQLKIGDGSTNVDALEFIAGKPQVVARIIRWEADD